jgi:hypothetical protein
MRRVKCPAVYDTISLDKETAMQTPEAEAVRLTAGFCLPVSHR